MTMSDDQHQAAALRVRRNGLWNIFDGLDLEVLGRLGLSEEILKQLLTLDTCPLDGFSAEVANVESTGEHGKALLRAFSSAASSSRSSFRPPSAVSTVRTTNTNEDEEEVNDESLLADYCWEKARLYRSLSSTVSEEIRDALQNRHRRNAVGNLFEILTPSQQLLLVEHLQEQLQGFSCFCDMPASDLVLASLSSASAEWSPSSSSPSDPSSTRLSPGGIVECR